MKKKVIATMMAGVLLTGCFGTTAMAGNVRDSTFDFYVTNSYKFTETRPKEDATSTYVLLHSAPTRFVYCGVQGLLPDGSHIDKTLGGHDVLMPLGEWEVRQTVYEDGCPAARLKFKQVTIEGYAAGKWSPDCVGHFPALN